MPVLGAAEAGNQPQRRRFCRSRGRAEQLDEGAARNGKIERAERRHAAVIHFRDAAQADGRPRVVTAASAAGSADALVDAKRSV